MAVRLRKSLFTWQERVVEGMALCGCRMAASTKDLAWALAIMIEKSIWTGEDLSGAAYDFSKCFDLVPKFLALRLLQAFGPQRAYTELSSPFIAA